MLQLSPYVTHQHTRRNGTVTPSADLQLTDSGDTCTTHVPSALRALGMDCSSTESGEGAEFTVHMCTNLNCTVQGGAWSAGWGFHADEPFPVQVVSSDVTIIRLQDTPSALQVLPCPLALVPSPHLHLACPAHKASRSVAAGGLTTYCVGPRVAPRHGLGPQGGMGATSVLGAESTSISSVYTLVDTRVVSFWLL